MGRQRSLKMGFDCSFAVLWAGGWRLEDLQQEVLELLLLYGCCHSAMICHIM